MTESPCSFCSPSTEQFQEALRNALVRLIYPLAPFIRPYVFLIPVRHVERFADLQPAESVALFDAAKAVNRGFADLYGATAMNLFTNDGVAAGQSAPHVHFHLFGRYEGEPASPFAILNDPKRRREKLSDDELRARADEVAAVVKPYWNE